MEGLIRAFIIGGIAYLYGLLQGCYITHSLGPIVASVVVYIVGALTILIIKQRRQSRRES